MGMTGNVEGMWGHGEGHGNMGMTGDLGTMR